MRKRGLAAAFLATLIGGTAALAAIDPLPYWAFPVPSHPWPKPEAGRQAHLPGSAKTYTLGQVDDRFHIPDWYPQDHPPMPSIIASGRKPDIPGCGFCHLPNGQGRPENAPLAGQPVDYIVQQVREMREGARKSSSSTMGSINSMYKLAKASNDAEIKIAAAYFAKLTYKKWIKVVETDTVPKTDTTSHNMIVTVPGRKEAIGQRILEVPQNVERAELRDSHSGFLAYVPKGAIARGQKLVDAGAGAFPCAACHGPQFKGNGSVPAIAGRSPSYLVRQLYDFQAGTRRGAGADMMRPEVAHLTAQNRLDIAAYLASLNP